MSLFFRICWSYSFLVFYLFAFIDFRGPRDFINKRGLLIQGGDYCNNYTYDYNHDYNNNNNSYDNNNNTDDNYDNDHNSNAK